MHTDRLTPFVDRVLSKKPDFGDIGRTYEVALLYAKNQSMTAIKRELDIHQEEVKRDIRKALTWFVENYKEPDVNNGENLLTDQNHALEVKGA